MAQPFAFQAAPVFLSEILASRQKPPVLAGQSATMPASLSTIGTFSTTPNVTCVFAPIASSTAWVTLLCPPSTPPSLPPVPVDPPPPVPLLPPLPPLPPLVVALSSPPHPIKIAV